MMTLKYGVPSSMNSSGVPMRLSIQGMSGMSERKIAERISMSLIRVFMSTFAFSLSPAPYALFMRIMDPVTSPDPSALSIILS